MPEMNFQKFTLVEIQITAAVAKISLPDNDILRNKKVVGIETYGRNSAGNGKSPINRVFITPQAMQESYLTFLCDNAEVLQQIPLQKILADGADKNVLAFEVTGISPTKSYIEFADTTSIAAGQSVCLGIYYED